VWGPGEGRPEKGRKKKTEEPEKKAHCGDFTKTEGGVKDRNQQAKDQRGKVTRGSPSICRKDNQFEREGSVGRAVLGKKGTETMTKDASAIISSHKNKGVREGPSSFNADKISLKLT